MSEVPFVDWVIRFVSWSEFVLVFELEEFGENVLVAVLELCEGLDANELIVEP